MNDCIVCGATQADEQQYWEDRADNDPDDGSWVGR